MVRRAVLIAALMTAAWPVAAAEPLPSARAMTPLLGVPYKLYARQSETETLRAANCLTAVVFALRRAGRACSALSPDQAWAHWRSKAQALRLGRTVIPPQGLLLFTRDHFLLLHTDRNGDSMVNADDDVIHAPYRPVEVTRLADWLNEKRADSAVWVMPIDERFACPTEAELRSLPARLRGARVSPR